jgi:superfamily II DNA or RNA helicase
MLTLRDYQENTLTSIKGALKEGHKNILVYAPTGAGKTVMFCAILERFITKNPGLRALIVVERVVLIQQTVNKLMDIGVIPQVLHRDSSFKNFQMPKPVVVTSADTLGRRLKGNPEYLEKAFKMVIIDECHHSYFNEKTADKSKYYPLFEFAQRNKAYVLGFTATPGRLSKKESLNEVYSTMVQASSLLELLTARHLCKFQVYSQPNAHLMAQLNSLEMVAGDYDQKGLGEVMSTPEMVEYSVNQWEKVCINIGRNLKTIAFTVTVEHARVLCEEFNNVGIIAEYITAKTPFSIRQKLFTEFSIGNIDVLISVGVLSEGFDVPSVECCLMVRPTASPSLYIQQVGRILRNSPGKKLAYLIDITANYQKHGCPTTYNPEEEFYKQAKKPSEGGTGESPTRTCPQCASEAPIQAKSCPVCGFIFPRKLREFVPVNVSLNSTLASLEFTKFKSITTHTGFLQNKFIEALNRGFKLEWANMKFKDKFGRFPKKEEYQYCLFSTEPTQAQADSFLQCLYLIAMERKLEEAWVIKWYNLMIPGGME